MSTILNWKDSQKKKSKKIPTRTHKEEHVDNQEDGEMEIAAYLAEAEGPFQLVLDLRIAHD